MKTLPQVSQSKWFLEEEISKTKQKLKELEFKKAKEEEEQKSNFFLYVKLTSNLASSFFAPFTDSFPETHVII